MKKDRFGHDTNVIWTDKKRYFGMPISFTRYSVVEKPGMWVKVFLDTGLLSTRHEEVHAYRIFDISIRQTLGDKIFGVGTIILQCKDISAPTLFLVRVKNPFQVRELIAEIVERERAEKGFRIGEFHS
jgi:hypothetical protein